VRLLLVEDDENKSVQLSRFVYAEFPEAELHLARSLQAGVRLVRKHAYDLVILDMTLPNYDAGPDEPGGGTTHSFGGREFLKQMDRFDISAPTIVVTQFETFGKASQTLDLDELDGQLMREHPENYVGSVYYHASIHGWHEELKILCQTALNSPARANDIDSNPHS
jgi:CheY-like chemotaxis protein